MEYFPQNNITLYVDANNNVLSFSDSTGNYTLSVNPGIVVHTYIIPINSELSPYLDNYKVLYSKMDGLHNNQILLYTVPHQAVAGAIPENIQHQFTRNDLINFGRQIAAKLQEFI
jgi:hypothetical protein